MKTNRQTIASWDEASALARRTQQGGGRVVFANGVFDLLHPGHVRLLAEARALGEVLIVAVNSDRSVRAIKGPGRPVNTAAERGEVLSSLASVDAVVIFDEPTPDEVIRRIQPDVLVKGEDWNADHIVGRDVVEARGGRVVRLPLEPQLSTTEIIRRIRGR